MGGILQERCGESLIEQIGDDRVGGVLELLDDTREHALVELLGNRHTREVSLTGGIVVLHGFTETTHEVGHIGRVHLMLLHQEGHETVGDIHTGCVAHGVGAGAQLCKRRGTRERVPGYKASSLLLRIYLEQFDLEDEGRERLDDVLLALTVSQLLGNIYLPD